MYNYFSHLQQEKLDIEKSKLVNTQAKIKASENLKRDMLVKSHNLKLKKLVVSLAASPIVIERYRDAPLFINPRENGRVASSIITRKPNSLNFNKRIGTSKRRRNIALNTDKDISVSSADSQKEVKANFIEKYISIMKPKTDLERLYNSIIRFFREESTFKFIKAYSFPLCNKLKSISNSSAHEEFYNTTKRCKNDLVILIEKLMKTDVYIRESKEVNLLKESFTTILKFLNDNKNKLNIENIAKSTANMFTESQLSEKKLIDKDYKVKFIRNKYKLGDSKLKNYISTPKNDDLEYLALNQTEMNKLKKSASSNVMKTLKKGDNHNPKQLYFNSLTSFMYKLEKEYKSTEKKRIYNVIKNSEIAELLNAENSLNQLKKKSVMNDYSVRFKNENLASRYISNVHDPEMVDEYNRDVLYISNMMQETGEDEFDKSKLFELKLILEKDKMEAGISSKRKNIKKNSESEDNLQSFVDKSPYIVINKKPFRENEFHKAIATIINNSHPLAK